MPAPANVPLGFVAAFGGDLSNPATRDAVLAAGWLPCDGSLYPNTDCPALREAIGTAHGGDAGSFRVPNLADRFVRGSRGSPSVDPDAAGRVAAAPGGATGNAVGSLQLSGTMLPTKPLVLAEDGAHQHAYQHLNTDMHEAWSGHTDTMARWSSTATVGAAGAHSHKLTGGDEQTVPVSVSLYWIIRATPAAATGICVPGAVGAFGAGANTPPAGWLSCNGMAQAVANSGNLAAVLESNFGGDGTSVFNLPDLRGRFVRGTSHGTNRDPGAASRYALHTGGNTGDEVGSSQAPATGTAQNPFVVETTGNHSHPQALVPANDHHAAWGASGPDAYNCMVWTSGWTSTTSAGLHTHDMAGGDKETRPENIYLEWLIAGDTINDAPPIGSILAYGGDVTEISNLTALLQAGWYPCIGQTLKTNDPASQAIYQVLGTLFGSTASTFALPDLRGYFVVGAGGKHKIAAAITASTAGRPVNDFIASMAPDHTHQVTGIPTDTHDIDVVYGVDLAENNSAPTGSSVAGAHSHAITGGWDAESRPVNVYVDYIIRFR